jgi:chromosome segregation ATPase
LIPSGLETDESQLTAGIEEVDRLLREAREIATHIADRMRSSGHAALTRSARLQRNLEAVRKDGAILHQKNQTLGRLIGDLGHHLGLIRTAIVSEQARIESTLGQLPADQDAETAAAMIQESITTLAKVSQATNRTAVEGHRLERDSGQIHARISDLQDLTISLQEEMPVLRRNAGSASTKTEALVTEVHRVVQRNNKLLDKTASKTARAEIKKQLHTLEQCALQMIEMDRRDRRRIGPSPALDNRTMEQNVPDFRVPMI